MINSNKVNIALLMLIPALMIQCGQSQEQDPSDQPHEQDSAGQQAELLDHIRPYCGYAYKGETTFITLGDGDHPLQDPDLIMVLAQCGEDEIRIPFYVDDDRSRTWILSMRDEGLHLAHDHRYPDGTEHDDNMYGGWANDEGTSFIQYFPSDSSTIDDRPVRERNKWSVEISPDTNEYIYSLFLEDELSYRAVFDLTDPHPTDI